MFGVMVPDRKIPERVVENIVDQMKGGTENPLLPSLLKLKSLDTESMLNLFYETVNKDKPAPYVTRYPNISVEDVKQKIQELYSRKVYTCDERFKRFFIEGLGYTEQDFDEIVLGKSPELIRPDGSFNFQEIARYFGFNREFVRRWKNMENVYENLEKLKKMDTTPQVIDWDFWEEQLGTEAVEVHKKALDQAIRNIPIFPVEAVFDLKKTHFDPLYDRIKDDVIDELPFLEKLVEDDVRMGQLHEHLDKYGDISINELLDKYMPHVRNEIDLEIENENWDFDYQEELRTVLEGKTMADFIVTKEEMKQYTESKWDELVSEYERSQVTGTTPLERAMKEYTRAQEDLKRLEAQVASMKGKEDQHEEEAQAAAGGEEKPQEEIDREAREKDPFRLVAQKYIIEMYKLEPDYFEKQAAQDREAREKAAAEKAAAEKAAAEAAAAASTKKGKK